MQQTHITYKQAFSSDKPSKVDIANSQYDEKRIVRGLRNQESEIIDWIYKRYLPLIKKLIIQRGGTSAEAADIFQEAITAVYINILKGKYKDQNKFSAYLRQVSLNMWNGQLRRKSRLPLKTSCYPQNDIMDHMFAYAEKAHLEELEANIRSAKLAELACTCLDQMKPNAQKLMRSYYFEGKKLKDLASQFGWTEGYIKQKIRRCRQKLEHLMMNSSVYKELMEE